MKYYLCKDGEMRTTLRIPVSITREEYLYYSRVARTLGFKSLQDAITRLGVADWALSAVARRGTKESAQRRVRS